MKNESPLNEKYVEGVGCVVARHRNPKAVLRECAKHSRWRLNAPLSLRIYSYTINLSASSHNEAFLIYTVEPTLGGRQELVDVLPSTMHPGEKRLPCIHFGKNPSQDGP
jgi:hypothetical protein